jgi:hypothetical protein
MSIAGYDRILKWAVVAIAMVVIAIASAKMIRSPYAKGDFEAFIHAANAIASGANLYATPSRPTAEGGLYYIYLPLFAIVLFPLTLLPIEISIVIWTALNAFLVYWIVGAFYELVSGEKLADLGFADKWIFALVPVLLTGRFLLHHFYYGQANIFVMAIIVLGLKLLNRKRGDLGGLCIGIAIVVKMIAAPFAMWLFTRLNPRELLGLAAGIILGVILVPSLIIGFDTNWAYVSHWTTGILLDGGLGTEKVPIAVNVSIQALFHRLFENVPAATLDGRPVYFTITVLPGAAIRALEAGFGLLLLAAICFYRFRFRRSGELISVWGGVALTFVIATLFAPTAQKHYFVLLLPAYLYAVYLWRVVGLQDRLFKALIAGSFLLAGFKMDGMFGDTADAYFFAASAISFGALLLAFAIFRAAYCLPDVKPEVLET